MIKIIRRVVFCGAIILALAIYYNAAKLPDIAASFSFMDRWFGISALFLLMLTLIPGIIFSYFPKFPINPVLMKTRKAMGISAFFFAFLHGILSSVFSLSGSVSSIFYLQKAQQISIILGFSALLILSALALTSFHKAVEILGGKKWKWLHRLVYVAAVLAVFHAYLIGSHFANPESFAVMLLKYSALSILILEAGATAMRIKRNDKLDSKIYYYAGLGILCIAGIMIAYNSSNVTQHAPHVSQSYFAMMHPDEFLIGNQTEATIRIVDKNLKPVEGFFVMQEHLMHAIIVRTDLTNYQHIHPTYHGGGIFKTHILLPEGGHYKMFAEYLTSDEAENLDVLNLKTKNSTAKRANLGAEMTMSRTGNLDVKLISKKPEFGKEQILQFEFNENGNKIQDLQPYLDSFGHLAVISEDFMHYTHVHPLDGPGMKAGPVVSFSTSFPMRGKYIMFLQFKRNGELMLTNFTLDVN